MFDCNITAASISQNATGNLEVGEERTLTATPTDNGRCNDAEKTPTWSAEPSGGVTFSAPTGSPVTITGRTIGSVSVRARYTFGNQRNFDASPLPVTVVQPVPDRIEPVNPNQQNGVAGEAVTNKPAARVLDKRGAPISGIQVTFALGLGGGQATGTTVSTGTDGIATVGSWTLGNAAGANTLVATVTSKPTLTVTFSAAGSAGPAAKLVKVDGDNQDVDISGQAPVRPSVKVTDIRDNPVSGKQVTFTVQGSGSATGTTQTTSTDGTATVGSWTMGSNVGQYKLDATISQPVLSVTFTANGVTSTVGSIVIIDGDNQTATVNTPVPIAPTVKVLSPGGQPVNARTVNFTIILNNGSVIGASPKTDHSGLATVGSWTLGQTAGQNSLQATVQGASVAGVTFKATGTAGAATQIAVSTGNNQTAIIGTAVATAPAVIVRDAFQNPVPNIQVNFVVVSGGGGLSGGTTATTLSDGVATTGSWTLGGSEGSNTLTATAVPSGIANNPVMFTANGIRAVAITAGANHTCIRTGTGLVYCWGANNAGQLGDNTTTNRNRPVLRSATVLDPMASLVAGGQHNCGIRGIDNKQVQCWGSNSKFQLFGGSVGFIADVSALAAGAEFSCAIRPTLVTHTVCVGSNFEGELGNNTTNPAGSSSPQLVQTADPAYVAIDAGDRFACAIRADFTAVCWGSNDFGQVGDASNTDRLVPTPVASTNTWSSISAGGSHACALSSVPATNGWAYCWGLSTSGQLGGGLPPGFPTNAPAPVNGTKSYVEITAGAIHTCAIQMTTFAAWCWGANVSGQLGSGNNTPQASPVVVNTAQTFTKIAAGMAHTCAIAVNNRVYCWGINSSGQLGTGTLPNSNVPTEVKF